MLSFRIGITLYKEFVIRIFKSLWNKLSCFQLYVKMYIHMCLLYFLKDMGQYTKKKKTLQSVHWGIKLKIQTKVLTYAYHRTVN